MKPPFFIQLTNHSSTQTLIHPTTENEFHSRSIFHLSVHTALMQSKLYYTDTFIIVYKLDKLNLLTACWLYSARIASIQPSSRANVLKYLISIYAYFFFCFLHFILVCCFILFVFFSFLT